MQKLYENWRQFINEGGVFVPRQGREGYAEPDLFGNPGETWFFKCPHGTCPDILADLIEQFGHDPRRKNPYMNSRGMEKFLTDPSQYNYKGTNRPFSKTMYFKRRPSPPKFIVLHITQTSSTGSTIRAFLKSKPGKRTSSHYEVSLDGATLEYLPPEVRAGHSGAGNKLGIGVDITGKIVDKKGPQFGEWILGGSSKQLNGLGKLIDKLSKEFGIPKIVAPYNFREMMWEMKGLQDLKLYASPREWEEIKSVYLCEQYDSVCEDPDGIMISAYHEALANNQKSKAKTIKQKREYKIKLLKSRRKQAWLKFRVSNEDIISNGIGIVAHHVVAADLRSCPGPYFPYGKYGKIWKIPEVEHITFEEWEVNPLGSTPTTEVSAEETDMAATGVEDPELTMSYPKDQTFDDEEEELLAPKGLPSDAGP